LAEQLTLNQRVEGSIPSALTICLYDLHRQPPLEPLTLTRISAKNRGNTRVVMARAAEKEPLTGVEYSCA
jgi:hypothetical protein